MAGKSDHPGPSIGPTAGQKLIEPAAFAADSTGVKASFDQPVSRRVFGHNYVRILLGVVVCLWTVPPVIVRAENYRPSISDPEVRASLAEKLERALSHSRQIKKTRRGNSDDLRISPLPPKPKPKAKSKAKLKPKAKAKAKPKSDPITLVIRRAVQRTFTEATRELPPPVVTIRWAYQGAGGPDHWGQLRPDFASCSAGQRQSPIALAAAIPITGSAPEIRYRPSRFEVLDDGRSLLVKVDPRNRLTYGRMPLRLTYIRLHRPGEHWLGPEPPDMSVHLVHENQHGPAMIVAVSLVRSEQDNPAVQSIIDGLPLEPGGRVKAMGMLDANGFLPPVDKRGFYVYDGSLTTPPCTEGIRWIVLTETVPVGARQLKTFERLFDLNARPLQAVAGRRIKRTM